MRNKDLPAMPLTDYTLTEVQVIDEGGAEVPVYIKAHGLSKREHMAAMAMQGICSNSEYIPTEDYHYSNVAEDAVQHADALLKELDNGN